jgi:UDP:flavonoid glycosyltransferase YjiC (YdhE family)
VRIIITSFGSLGDLNPYLGLGRALEARGHRVILALPRHYQPYVAAAGLNGHAIRPDLDPADRDAVRKVMHPFRGAEFLIREWLMPNVEDSYADLDALVKDDDIVISHPLTYAAPVLAERRKLLWASTVLAPLGFFSQADPPLMAVHPAAAALQRNAPGLYARLIPLARVATRRWSEPLKRLRQRLGLPPGADPVHAGQFSPFLNLAMFSRLLAEPQRDWPPHTVVTGAVSHDAVHGGMPESLTQFLDDGPAPMVFTLGTSAVGATSAPRFYQASVEAAADVGARAVLLVGQHDGHLSHIRNSDTVHVAGWAPHSELFARASVIVHQGGAGTLHTALASGRPMLIVPHAHDQGDNAVRSARLGVARVLFPSQYTRKAVRDHLRFLISDSAALARARDVAARIHQEDGARAASEAIDVLARRANPSTRSSVPIP